MNRTVRRASAYAAVGALSLSAPLLGPAAVVPFLVVAALALVVTDGPIFHLFARQGDRQRGRLAALFAFAVSAAVLGWLSTVGSLPVEVFVGSVLLVVIGNLGAEVARTVLGVRSTIGFLVGGTVGGAVGILAGAGMAGETVVPGAVIFLAVVGAMIGGLVRSMLFPRDEPPILLTVGLVLWFLAGVDAGGDSVTVATAVGVMALFGVLSYLLDTASIEGGIAGVVLGLLTIVLGGYDWFALLLAFFAIGGLATKFRYERKLERGVAEENGGNRGGINVLANSLVAVVAVCVLAASEAGAIDVDTLAVLLFYAGAVATALGDTLSSEIGGAFDGTRLITTFEHVEPGTDGAVTIQGTLAGVAGAAGIGALTAFLFPPVAAVGVLVVGVAGLVGMSVDSVLGATVEGGLLGNSGVNFAATLAGAIACLVLALAIGEVSLAGVAP